MTAGLPDLQVALFAPSERGVQELASAAAWDGDTIASSSWAEVLGALRSEKTAAVVVAAAGADECLLLLREATEAAPRAVRLAVCPPEERLPLVRALNAGALENWIPAPLADDELRSALRSALMIRSTEARARELVDLLCRRHEVEHRELDVLREEVAALRQRFDRISPTDRVTGLYNRRHLLDHWRRECARARRYGTRLSIVLLAPVPDEGLHDHDLRRIGSFLVQAIRDVDLAGRAGDDRFAVILPHCDRADAEMLAQRLVARFARGGFADSQPGGSGGWDPVAPAEPGAGGRRAGLSIDLPSGPWSPVSDVPAEPALRLKAAVAALGQDGDGPGPVLDAAERALAAMVGPFAT